MVVWRADTKIRQQHQTKTNFSYFKNNFKTAVKTTINKSQNNDVGDNKMRFEATKRWRVKTGGFTKKL